MNDLPECNQSAHYKSGLALLVRHPLVWLPHSRATLLEHLVGTHSILCDWKLPEPVALAGLFHSAYGTLGSHHQLWREQDRPTIRSAIGCDAEQLAWQYGRTDLIGLTLQQHVDIEQIQKSNNSLLHIFIANFLEQHQRQPRNIGRENKMTLDRCVQVLCDGAATQLHAALHSLSETRISSL